MSSGGVGVAQLEQVMVDRLVDQLQFGGLDIEVLEDLRPQAFGVDDYGVGDADRPRVAQAPVGANRGRNRIRRGEGVHGFHVHDQGPCRVHHRRHQCVEDVYVIEGQAER